MYVCMYEGIKDPKDIHVDHLWAKLQEASRAEFGKIEVSESATQD